MLPEKNPMKISAIYPVRSHDIDSSGRLSIVSMCNFLFDAAGQHAHKLGLSVQNLMTENYTWVLSRMLVRIHSFPAWGDELTIETWPSGIRKLFAMRDFRLIDKKGRNLGTAVTAWLVIDTSTRRPMRPKPFLDKIHFTDSDYPAKNMPEKLPGLDGHDYIQHFPVLHRDIDINRHVTSGSYIGWIIENIPEELHNSGSLTDLGISFLAESFYGEHVVSLCKAQNDDRTVFLHSIIREEDSQELVRAKTVWELKD